MERGAAYGVDTPPSALLTASDPLAVWGMRRVHTTHSPVRQAPQARWRSTERHRPLYSLRAARHYGKGPVELGGWGCAP